MNSDWLPSKPQFRSFTEITPAARRIARAHNRCGPALAGGVLAFDREGNGGEWYSAGSRPDAEIVYPVGWRRVGDRDVQDWLDRRRVG